MTESNCSTVDVHLVDIKAEFSYTVDVHRRKGFVDLHEMRRLVRKNCGGSNKQRIQTSNRSTSSFVIPTCERTVAMAMLGAMPMMRGARAIDAVVTCFAMIFKPRASALLRFISRTAAAPSVI